MTTKNLFASLAVRRDQEEVEHRNQQETQTNTVEDLLKGNTDQKRKRKVRPEEKKVLDEEKAKSNPIQKEEGFKEVKKKNKTQDDVSEIQSNEEIHKEDHRNKGKTPTYFPKYTQNKRMFDRNSKLPRGKEAAKGGAGRKTTWGSVNEYVRNEYDYYYTGEDDCN